jgi:hypothetical protein
MSNQILPPINYYTNESNWGNYQYITLSQLVDNFMLNYVGDDKLLSNVKRYNVLSHFKRGIQEFNYDSVKEVKAMEVELSDSLLLTLPVDYVSYVRISVVSANGLLKPLSRDTRTTLGTAYLQDNQYQLLFDQNGYPLEAQTSEAFKRYSIASSSEYNDECLETSNFGVNTNQNGNGYFNIDKRRGVISFSSNIGSKVIVLEYVSDGLEYNNGDDIQIHKFAEQALYNYVRYMIINNKFGVPEYVVNRAKKDYYNELQNTRIRMMELRGSELLILLKGRNKWLK